jgi:hypothetical protein
MSIATASSTLADPGAAFDTAYERLRSQLGDDPTLVLVFHTDAYPAEALQAATKALPTSVQVHGASVCRGVMTEEGFHGEDGRALGLWGLSDLTASVGVGMAPFEDDAQAAGIRALQQALSRAGRPGESPDLVWITASPGFEEQILRGIQDVLGATVPVVGGSAADNGALGRWSLFTRDERLSTGVAVTVIYTAFDTASSFQSGYSPTGLHGRITEAHGRTLVSIDGRPAAQVYNEWTDGLIAGALNGGLILPITSLSPFGRIAGKVGRMACYKLSHPHEVLPDGALSLFTEVEVGEDLVLMSGSARTLLTRAARVTEAALEFERVQREDVLGGLVVFCAGCMLTVQGQMPKVADGLKKAFGDKPFFAAFTFGEQGCVAGRQSIHGNLMISSLVFSRGRT